MATQHEFENLMPAQMALIPQDKYDSTNTMPQLARLSSAELAPLIPALLTWLESSMWPIFSPVAELVMKYPELAVEPTRFALRNNDKDGRMDDGEWMNALLQVVVEELPLETRRTFREEVLRIRDSPTKDEKDWGVDEQAERVLKEMDGEVIVKS
jgi:hypothetical protein